MNITGKQIGNYRLVAPINSGSYGSVYRANHIILSDRIVAVKLLHAYLDSAREREKFLQEARLLARLKHQHILPIHDVGFSDELPYIVVEYAPGGSLRDRLKQQPGPFPLAEALRLLIQVGQALEHAHQQNIIHRDLKPENILFNEYREGLLADFGIATVVDTSSMRQTGIIGTPTYMAPEQFQGTASKEGDQYALGCLAYELFTGRKVFDAPNFVAMGYLHATEAPTPPTRYNAQLPIHIEQAILRALAKERRDRYPGVSAFLDVLKGISEEEYSIQPTLPSEEISTGPLPSSALELYNAGNTFYDQKQYEMALKVFTEAARLEPGNANYHIGRARTLHTLKRYEQALVASKEAARLMPKVPMYARMQGDALYELKRYPEALQAFERAAQLEPKVSYYHKMQGDALYELKRYPEAIQAFERAAQREPDASPYLKKIAEIQALIKPKEPATPQNKPKEPTTSQNKLKEQAAAQSKQGATFTASKQYEKALEAFSEAVRLQPEQADYHGARGRTLHALKRYEQALTAFQEAAHLDPMRGYYHRMQGDALYELKRYQQALHAFERAVQLDPGATSYRKRITEIQAQIKSEEQAATQLKSKEQAASLYKQGNALFTAKQYTKALQAFTEAVRLQPGNTNYRKRMAEVQAQIKREEDAHSQIKSKEQAASLFVQGGTLFTSKQYEKALEAFTEAIRLQSGNADYHSARGHTLHALKRYEQALTAFQEATRLAPETYDYSRCQGDALYELKRYEQALHAFERAAQMEPRIGYYHKMQGESLYKLKRYQEALLAFERAAQLETGNPPHHKRIEEVLLQLKQEEQTRSQNASKEKAASLYKQGNTFTSTKQHEQALTAYWGAVNQQPNNPTYVSALARTFDTLHQYENALSAFASAAYLQPQNSNHLKMQAEILWKLKRHQEALAMYEQAISVEPRKVYRQRLEELRIQAKEQETGLQKFLNFFR